MSQDTYTANVTTENEQVYERFRHIASDSKEGVDERIDIDLAEFTGGTDDDESDPAEDTKEVPQYDLYGVPFVYGQETDDAVDYDTLAEINGWSDAKVSWPDDDPFWVNSLPHFDGDVTREFFDGDLDAMDSFHAGDHSAFGDTPEDAIRTLVTESVETLKLPRNDTVEILSEFLTEDLDESFVRQIHNEHDFLKNPFQFLGIDLIKYDGAYYDSRTGEGVFEMDRVTNFAIDPLAHIRFEGDEYFELKVVPSVRFEDPYNVVVPATVFNDKRRFMDEVTDGRTTRFDGTQRHLNDLREFVGAYPAPAKEAVDRITIRDGHLVSPEGTLTKDGWVEDAPYVWHTRTNEPVENRWMLSPEDTEFDEDEVIGALELLSDIREDEEILPVTGWFYSAGFSELISGVEGGKNALNITGSAEAGKSVTMKILGKMMGMDYQAHGLLDCKLSNFAVDRVFNGSDCVPMLFDEYTPSRMPNHVDERFKNALKQVTGGTSTPKGQKDQSLIEWELHAPVAFNGEQAISGNAETRRSIMATFLHGSSRDGTPTAKAWAELTGDTFTSPDGEVTLGRGYDAQDHALAWYLFVLEQFDDEDALVEKYMEAKRDVQEWIVPLNLQGLQNMHKQGFATVLFGNRMANEFAKWLGHDEAVFTEEANKEAIKSLAETVGLRGSESELDEFLYLFGMAARKGIAEENGEFKWVHFESPNEELRVNIDYAFSAVQEYLKQTGQRNTNVFNKVSEYKRLVREASEEDDPAIVTVSEDGLGQNTPPINRAVGFDVDVLSERIDGFTRFMFVDEPMHKHEVTHSDAMDPGDEATSIGGLSPGPHTLTVRVAQKAEMPAAHFEEDGYLEDGTGKVRYVIWSRSEPSDIDLELGETYCIRDAKVTEYEGETIVDVEPGMTDVIPIDEGFGFLAGDDAESTTEDVVEA